MLQLYDACGSILASFDEPPHVVSETNILITPKGLNTKNERVVSPVHYY